MTDAHDSLTWWCRLTLRALAASFAVVGTLFLFCPDATVRTMNVVGAALGRFPPAPPSALRFWLSLATGYMVLVTALAYLAQRDLHRHRPLLALLALGKATSSLTCLVFYLGSLDAFIYLANFLVDGSIAVAALGIWLVVPTLPRVAEPIAGDRAVDAAADRTFRSLAETMVPSGGPFPAGAHDVLCVDDVGHFIAGGGAGAPRALRLALQLFDLTPYVLPPVRRRRFSNLPLSDRVATLDAWEQSRLPPRRQFIHLLKLLVMVHFYSRPDVSAELHYQHPLERVPRTEIRAA